MIVIINYYVFAECIKFHNVEWFRLGLNISHTYWLPARHIHETQFGVHHHFTFFFRLLSLFLSAPLFVISLPCSSHYIHLSSSSACCVCLFRMSMQQHCCSHIYKHHKHVIIFGIISERFCSRLLLHGRGNVYIRNAVEMLH